MSFFDQLNDLQCVGLLAIYICAVFVLVRFSAFNGRDEEEDMGGGE